LVLFILNRKKDATDPISHPTMLFRRTDAKDVGFTGLEK